MGCVVLGCWLGLNHDNVESICTGKLPVKFPIPVLSVAIILYTLDTLYMPEKEVNVHESLLFSAMYL